MEMFQPLSGRRQQYSRNDQPYRREPAPPRPPSPDTTLSEQIVQVENKTFTVQMRSNRRGTFLRVVEDTNGKRSSIAVPDTGIDGLIDAIAHCRADCEQPART